MITVNETDRTILFEPHTKAKKKGQGPLRQNLISAHICPRCRAPIQAVVATTREIPLSLFSGGFHYESWPIGNSAGIAAVQLLAKHHLSDWCLSEDVGKGLTKKSSATDRACPMVAFFSPSALEQVSKLLLPLGALRTAGLIADLSHMDLFSTLVNRTSDRLLKINDMANHFHPMFALDSRQAGAITGFCDELLSITGGNVR